MQGSEPLAAQRSINVRIRSRPLFEHLSVFVLIILGLLFVRTDAIDSALARLRLKPESFDAVVCTHHAAIVCIMFPIMIRSGHTDD